MVLIMNFRTEEAPSNLVVQIVDKMPNLSCIYKFGIFMQMVYNLFSKEFNIHYFGSFTFCKWLKRNQVKILNGPATVNGILTLLVHWDYLGRLSELKPWVRRLARIICKWTFREKGMHNWYLIIPSLVVSVISIR